MSVSYLKCVWCGNGFWTAPYRFFECYECAGYITKTKDFTYDCDKRTLSFRDGIVELDISVTNHIALYTIKVIIPDSVKKIGNHMFSRFECLKEIKLPQNLQSIGDKSFMACYALRKIIIPPKLESIGYKTFEECDCLFEMDKHEIVSPFIQGYFWNAISKPKMMKCEQTKWKDTINTGCLECGSWRSDFGCSWKCLEFGCQIGKLYDFDGSKLTLYFNIERYHKFNISKEILDNVEIIEVTQGKSMFHMDFFQQFPNLKEVYLPNSITIIGDYIFTHCFQLRYIKLPENLESIGAECFTRCDNLQQIFIPPSVQRIGDECFKLCTSLRFVKLPENLKTIERGTFDSCFALQEINFPKEIETVNNNSFRNCYSLRFIKLPSTNLKIFGFQQIFTNYPDDLFVELSSITDKECNAGYNIINQLASLGINMSYRQSKFIDEGISVDLEIEEYHSFDVDAWFRIKYENPYSSKGFNVPLNLATLDGDEYPLKPEKWVENDSQKIIQILKNTYSIFEENDIELLIEGEEESVEDMTPLHLIQKMYKKKELIGNPILIVYV